MESTHYQRPGWATTHVFNKAVAGLTRLGLSVWGSRVLEVAGRKSGLPRQTPINLLTHDHNTYVVAPRGETEWVRNVRAADGELALIKGRRRQAFRATEVTDPDQKSAILRSYLEKWKAEVGVFFDGVGPNSTDDELRAIAGRHPVFALTASETPPVPLWRRPRR